MAVASLGACRRRDAAETGSASTQIVLVTPALLLLVMLCVQFALWQHAGHVATAAAQRGLTEAQAEGGTASAGRREASRFLARAGRRLVQSPRISASRSRTRARVVVTARVVSLVPGLRFTVQGRSAGPVEQFLPRSRR